MTVVTPQTLLPMHVIDKILFSYVQLSPVAFPQVGFSVASHAGAGLGGIGFGFCCVLFSRCDREYAAKNDFQKDEQIDEFHFSIIPQAVITIKKITAAVARKFKILRGRPSLSTPIQERHKYHHQAAKRKKQYTDHLAFQAIDVSRQMFKRLKHKQEIPLGLYSLWRRAERIGFLPKLPRKQRRQRRQNR